MLSVRTRDGVAVGDQIRGHAFQLKGKLIMETSEERDIRLQLAS